MTPVDYKFCESSPGFLNWLQLGCRFQEYTSQFENNLKNLMQIGGGSIFSDRRILKPIREKMNSYQLLNNNIVRWN